MAPTHQRAQNNETLPPAHTSHFELYLVPITLYQPLPHRPDRDGDETTTTHDPTGNKLVEACVARCIHNLTLTLSVTGFEWVSATGHLEAW